VEETVACCALAAFLISQLIFGLDWLRERMGMAQPQAVRVNPASVWRLGAPVEPLPARPRLSGPMAARLNLALAGGLFAFTILASLALYFSADPNRWGALAVICTGHGVERIPAPAG
jgi:hypothetical protein